MENSPASSSIAAFMGLPVNGLMDVAAVVLLAGFIPILAVISVIARTAQSRQKLDVATELYDLHGDRYLEMFIKRNQPALWKQAIFPILVMFLIGAYFAFFIMFPGAVLHSPDQTTGNGPISNLIMLGPKWGAKVDQLWAYSVGTATAITFAYLGWYVWSIATIFSRFSTLELVAGTYMNVMIRLVMAVLLAIVFRHLSGAVNSSIIELSPVAIGFGVGVFPDAALTWITRELRSRLLGETKSSTDAPLDLIQGVSPFRKTRLFEMGMDNCQNLADCNPVQLFVTSNLGLMEVLDWIGQAQLAVLVGADNFSKLQVNGWRTASDFQRAIQGSAKPVLAGLLGYDERQLDDLGAGLRDNPNFTRLEALTERIRASENRDEGGQVPPLSSPGAAPQTI